MNKAIAAFLISTIMTMPNTATLAQGYAAAPWPDHAQGRALPKPDWILAIPARRNADNSLTIWDRNDDWAKSWRVPRLIDGIRVVTLMGDTEDKRSITAAAIDGMLVDEMDVVIRKYKAPALALAVYDGTYVAVAGYVPGWQASWVGVQSGIDTQETRENTILALSSLFTESKGAIPLQENSTEIEILASRQNNYSGGTDYRLRIIGPENGLVANLDILSSIPNLIITDVQRETSNSLTVIAETYLSSEELLGYLKSYGLMP